jgi:NDP-sugar pyrophosphorylase family protein
VTSPRQRTQCVILAGGLGTRMYPLTQTIPKALLPVHGRPFALYQLDCMRRHGVTDVVYSIGHLGDRIRAAIGDGEQLGLHVAYSDEGTRALGTGGALRLACDAGLLDPSFLVTYADSYLRIDFAAVMARLHIADKPAILVAYRNDDRWDRSNVKLTGPDVAFYDKRAGHGETFTHIDYGLAALHRDVVYEIPDGRSDLADFYHRLSTQGRLGVFEADQRFYEIGSMRGLADFEAWVAGHPTELLCPA